MAPRADSPTMRGLGPRVLSALVLAPTVFALAYAGGVAFDLLVVAAAGAMAFEWNRLCNGDVVVTGAALATTVVASVACAAWGAPGIALIAVAAAATLVFAVAWAAGARRLWSALGVVYIALPCVAVVWLRADPTRGLETVFWLFAVVWATDVGAFFAGRGFGGPRLAPRISPNKTWSGLFGGFVCAAATGAAAAAILDLPNLLPLALFSAMLALVAQAGDLWESMVKRHFGVKDSGSLIPGHGGVLDRLDGLLTTAPAVAVAALLGGEEMFAWR